MNEYRFTAEIARQTRTATASIPERSYGGIRVLADWTPLASDDDIVRIDVRVTGDLDPRDAPSYVELFFHDVFLILNIATPSSFGGVITVTGGEFRVNDLSFDATPFACGITSSIPLSEVASWYPSETSQIAATPMQTVLFHLLHIDRGGHDEWMQRVRLIECLRALGIDEPIDEMPIIHPMHDESLDARIDDTDVVDRAMLRVLTAIQDTIRSNDTRDPAASDLRA
ncbi:MAG: hypothetical protein QOE82_1937 [Thermoanaerobaculia bacterium]|nr:hypothetical protein [Thermoanaerobaculia bacterium]